MPSLPADTVLTAFRTAGFDFVTGVPCSYLTPLIDAVIGSPQMRYVPAANEGDAIAIAARDLALAGQPPGAGRRLLLEDVVAVHLAPHDLAGTGDLVALLRTGVRLHLGHRGSPAGGRGSVRGRVSGGVDRRDLDLGGRGVGGDHVGGFRTVVEGINKVYKHVRPNRQNPRGGRLSIEMPIDASNVLLVNPELGRGVRTGVRINEAGDKVRFCKKTGKELSVVRPAKKK